jgi:hypothetical protein
MTDTPQTPDQREEPPARKPFAAFLVEQRRGGLAADLADAMAEVTLAVAETGKAGALTLTITVAANGQGAVKVGDSIKKKVPQVAQPEAFFYVDANGNLSRSDPRQPELPVGADQLAQRREGAGA